MELPAQKHRRLRQRPVQSLNSCKKWHPKIRKQGREPNEITAEPSGKAGNQVIHHAQNDVCRERPQLQALFLGLGKARCTLKQLSTSHTIVHLRVHQLHGRDHIVQRESRRRDQLANRDF